MALNQQQLAEDILQYSSGRQLWLAYSGGVDSHALLYLLANSTIPQFKNCNVIHVDHGLHQDAASWSTHCAAQADRYGFEFYCLPVKVAGRAEVGLEAAARQARYEAMADLVGEQGVLLSAQHQQDQAETLLLQLMRGAGPKGLAAMAIDSQLMGMQIMRPLLHTAQQDIIDYARQHQLHWIEDPSNLDTRIKRNFLRHQVWPLLEQCWPALSSTIARSAGHCADMSAMADALADIDKQSTVCSSDDTVIIIAELVKLPLARQRNLLRFLLGQAGLPLPSAAVLQCIVDDLCHAGDDKQPLVRWQGAEARRYQQRLYLLKPQSVDSSYTEVKLTEPRPLSLADGREIEWQQRLGQGLKADLFRSGLTLRFRRGGESIQPQGQRHHKKLKQLFQQWQIPPWQRAQVPLIFQQQQLLAVIGFAVAEQAGVSATELGWFPLLKPPQ